MDQTVSYANLLTQVMREEAKLQPSVQPRLKVVSSCDSETGQFLLIVIGWDNRKHRVHNILFHAQLVDGKVIIETDMTEEGLMPALIEAGIPEEDIISGSPLRKLEAEPVAV
ncbi:MAG: element excision factor XisI family protein [Acidobacteriota bacterium]